MAEGTKAGQLFWFSATIPWCCVDAVKRSACIEGARMALARVKTYWAGMEATAIVARGPAGGQDSAEHYFEEVLEGAHLIEAQCSKSAMFE